MAATAVGFNNGHMNITDTHTLVGPRSEERSRTPLSVFQTKARSEPQSCDSCSHCSLWARGGLTNALVCAVCACKSFARTPKQEDALSQPEETPQSQSTFLFVSVFPYCLLWRLEMESSGIRHPNIAMCFHCLFIIQMTKKHTRDLRICKPFGSEPYIPMF